MRWYCSCPPVSWPCGRFVRLGPLGYPTDSTVLRYLPDTDRLRAIGTAIDPNVLGALLMIVGIIALTQLLASEPVLPRRWLVIAACGGAARVARDLLA